MSENFESPKPDQPEALTSATTYEQFYKLGIYPDATIDSEEKLCKVVSIVEDPHFEGGGYVETIDEEDRETTYSFTQLVDADAWVLEKDSPIAKNPHVKRLEFGFKQMTKAFQDPYINMRGNNSTEKKRLVNSKRALERDLRIATRVAFQSLIPAIHPGTVIESTLNIKRRVLEITYNNSLEEGGNVVVEKTDDHGKVTKEIMPLGDFLDPTTREMHRNIRTLIPSQKRSS